MLNANRPSDLTGTLLAGRYRILQKLGEGAMGAVYLGEHLRIGRRDAIKVLRDNLSGDPEAIARFNRGARNVAAIHHPNVCTIYDYSDTGDGTQFLAMQFIPGESLKDLIDREGVLPLERAVAIAKQTADALQAAHEAGIVHRDLKPANIMISPGRAGEDLVTVVDFDIAKGSQEGEESEVTRLGFVVGTPEYMSPEQLTGDRLDGRSDIYSLALVLFRMLTGSLPFPGQTAQDLMIQRLTHTPLRFDQVGGGTAVPEKLQAIVTRALERKPGDRPRDAAEFGLELMAAIGGDASAVRVPPRGVGSAVAGATADPAEAIPRTRVAPRVPASRAPQVAGGGAEASAGAGARSARPLWLAGAAVALVAIAGIGFLAFGGGTDARDAGATAGVEAPPGGDPFAGLPDSPGDGTDAGAGATADPTMTPAAAGSGSALVAPPPVSPAPAGSPGAVTTTPTPPTPPPAGAPPGAPAILVAADQVNPTLWRMFERLGPPEPSAAGLSAIRDTADAIWSAGGVSSNDRAMAAYIAGSAWFALGSPAQCATWLERALQVRPDGPGYRDMLESCRTGAP